MRITKIFTFDAAHRLTDYPGKCQNLHGHTYKAEATIEGPKNDLGMVLDFRELKQLFREKIESKFDHKTILKKDDPLNQKLARAIPKNKNWITWVSYNPTAENIAEDIFKALSKEISTYKNLKLTKIKLWETPNSFAEVESPIN